MLLAERYKEQIAGVISRYDRLVTQGTLQGWCFAGGMTSFLNANTIIIFDYPQFANASHAEAIARENDLEIELIRKSKAFRREEPSKRSSENVGHIPAWRISSRRLRHVRAANPGMTRLPARLFSNALYNKFMRSETV